MTARHWLASYGSIPAEIDADAHASVVALTDDAMIRFAGKTAFVCAGQQFSYAEIDALSGNFCAYLQSVGVKKGDRVAVMLPNIAAFPIALLGIIRAGAVQVNVNPLYTPRELEHQLRDSGSEQIVIYGDALPTLAAIIANTPVRQVLVAGRPSVGDALGDEMSVDGFDNAVTLRTALARGSTLQREPVAVSGGDLLFLQYTGGHRALEGRSAVASQSGR
jgi:long-chain acyl-CoA synthetase